MKEKQQQQQHEEEEEAIENHGMVGDMHTVALIAKNGNVNWMCYPYFDSPSIFAAILDCQKGGVFRIHPTDGHHDHVVYRQFYWPETNVLVTRFKCSQGVGEIRDFMTVSSRQQVQDGEHQTRLVRQVIAVRGTITLEVTCKPALDYARDADQHTVSITETGATFQTDKTAIKLTTDVPLEEQNKAATAQFTLCKGETKTFVISGPDGQAEPLTAKETGELFDGNVKFWREWLSRCTYKGRWRAAVYRSALVLKLLTFQPTGAIIAAPTMGLPEHLGGERNWDYRYVWIRDAAFTVYGLIRVGFTEEAEAFMHWLMERIVEPDSDIGPLQPLYTIHGENHVPETQLDHLGGHKKSQPIRLGNAAYGQLQLDIYGELMDAIYLFNKYGHPVSYDLWRHLRSITNWLCENWQRKDEGIWEVRGEKCNLVYSRLMCWVALDRALRLADKRSFPAPRDKWLQNRDAIYEEIITKGWSSELGAFVQSYETAALDASTLVMPLVFFMSPSDPQMLATIDAILKSPDEGGLTEDSLVYRYNPKLTPDGLEGEEGTFNMCTFWLVEALTRAGAYEPERLDHARLLFERMLGYANHVGLYAEESGSMDNALGNFPQAFTHLALISAAFNLDRVWGRR